MPIFSYFAVAGSILVALLFLADAGVEKGGPLPNNNEFAGMPKPWRPDSTRPVSKAQVLIATPAPAPDMLSEAVKAAAPPPSPLIAEASETTGVAVSLEAPKEVPKRKRVAKKHVQPDNRQNFASRYGDGSPFGGGPFGRF